MILGAPLPVVPTADERQTHRLVYPPIGACWVLYWSGEAFEGGQTITLSLPWGQPAMLIRGGGMIALNVTGQHFDRCADQRDFSAVSMQDVGESTDGCVEDGGETEA